MKKILGSIILTSSIILSACGGATSLKGGKGISVEIKIDSISEGKAVIERLPAGPKRIQLDTVELNSDGTAKFDIAANGIGFYSVFIIGTEGEIRFIGEQGDQLTLTGNAKQLTASSQISGSPENDRLNKLLTVFNRVQKMSDSLNTIYREAQSRQMHYPLTEKFQAIYQEAKIKEEKAVVDYINANPSQFSNIIALNSLDRDRHAELFKSTDKALYEAYPNSEDVQKLHDFVLKYFAISKGAIAPNFTLLNEEGKSISLSDFKGKYVLLDFWATWCNPCIKEIPNLAKAQGNFGGEKFEVVSVCIDKDSEASKSMWKRILSEHNANWTQLYDAGGQSTSKPYQITHFPTMIIVNPEGKIEDKGPHIRGEKMLSIIQNLVGNE